MTDIGKNIIIYSGLEREHAMGTANVITDRLLNSVTVFKVINKNMCAISVLSK